MDPIPQPSPTARGKAGAGGETELRTSAGSGRFEEACLDQLDAVYRFSVYLTGNQVDAEDLAQDALLQALRKRHLFQPGTDLKAWLFRITRNLHIDQLRRRKLAPQVADLADVPARAEASSQGNDESVRTLLEDPLGGGSGAEAPPELSPEEDASLYERFGDEVGKFLAELPRTFRLALVLCDVEDMSYEEISEALGCPLGTVRSRISRARQFLREKLYDYARELGFTRGTREST